MKNIFKFEITTKKLVLMGLFIALCFVGGNIKVFGSVAFDSMPAYLGTLLLGPIYGAIIGMLGHLFTALTSGFPMTLPVHIIISLDMALTMLMAYSAFQLGNKYNKNMAYILFIIVGVLFNGPIGVFMLIPILGKGVIGMLPILSVVALINIVIAIGVFILVPITERRNLL